MVFTYSLIQPAAESTNGLIFLFDHDRMLVAREGGLYRIPGVADLQGDASLLPPLFAFGKIDKKECYTGSLNNDTIALKNSMLSLVSLRKLFYELPEVLFQAALSALHTVQWSGNTRFCGQCGGTMELSRTESAKVCCSCNYVHYPKISPAVIVAVVKGNKILLGHSDRFPQKLYSVIAGFVEPGETLEACVVREVKEETGIEVDNVTYFGSQPWPFPDSLMIGFTARYAGGTICVDGDEMVDADWFSAQSIPNIPDGVSISRKLIDWFLEANKE